MSRFSPLRMKLVRLGLTGGFMLVAARSAQLALAPDPRLARLAERQYSSPVELAPKRGRVYDRRGNVLAQSVEVESIYAEPRRFQAMPPERRRKAIAQLAAALSLPERTVAERLDSSRGFVWLARRVDPGVAKATALLELEGVGAVKESKRFYPNVELAGHVLGFSGVDSEGLEGLEREYDAVLKSRARRFERPRDARGRSYVPRGADEVFVGVEDDGQELVLTLDRQIQYLAEAALRKGVLNARARGGFVVVQDPRNGEILAMAGQPTYNPNAFAKHRPEEWRNRAVTDVFEPGSTLKPLLIAAALDAGVVKTSDIFFCENGALDVADLTIRDSKKHGWLDVARILAVSSNIGMIKIGRLLGRDAWYDSLHAFGFGSKTGIDLPGEPAGLIPPRKRWSTVTLASASFGHNVGVTGIQLTTAISAIANGGTLMRPYVVRRLLGPDGRVIRDVEAVEVRRVVSTEAAAKVTAMMEKVVSPEGTGLAAAIPDYRVAGKTGTAQKVDPISGGYSDKRIASFVGFVPASRPRLTIAVVIDEPKTSVYGGVVAAPIFRQIAEEALRYLTVPPDAAGNPVATGAVGDDAVGEGFLADRVPPSRSAALDAKLAQQVGGASSEKLAAVRALAAERIAGNLRSAEEAPAGSVPDFAGLSVRGALRVAEPRRLLLEVRGSGRAIRQEPEPGARAEPGTKVTIWFTGRGA